MKHCYKCMKNKDETEFNKCKNRLDGLQSQCRECKKEYLRRYYYSEQGQQVNKNYHERNKAQRNEASRMYYAANTEKCNVYSRQYYAANKEKWIEANKRWYSENKPYYRAKDALRNKRKQAVNEITTSEDKWLLREIYELAKLRTQVTGVQWEVDHIHPISLGGKHSLYNLQVVPASWNRIKSNKHTEKFFGA